MSRENCPICDRQMVATSGPPSEILLVGEFPGPEEVIKGVPFVGKAGDVLKDELTKAGISYRTCRVTNLWSHNKPSEKKEYYAEDFDFHFKRLMEEISKAKYVLLMGSELAPIFTGHNVSDVAGLNLIGEVESKIPLPKSLKVCVFAHNPAFVFHGPVGEFRQAIQRFKELIS